MDSARQLLIAGGGIGGLAAALAAARAGWQARLLERAGQFSEVGAGVQLGPNVTRILRGWGLERDLLAAAAVPGRLQVRDALDGAELGALPLGPRAVDRYGAPYVTIHRADLHGLLCAAATAEAGVQIRLNHELTGFRDDGQAVTVNIAGGKQVQGDALLGADGVWSGLRQQLLADGPPRVTGHLAYRAMLRQSALPQALRTAQVTVWLGPRQHVVQYPVRGGDWMNLVAIVRGAPPRDVQTWDHGANAADLRRATGAVCAPLRDLLDAAPSASVNADAWRLWPLSGRAPVRSADQMARGLAALLGDAAHPMFPYLAQGAGMAIEDAFELARVLAMDAVDVPTRLQCYAQARWQRVARVQARSIRNGQIFHATGLLRLGRNAAIALLGERILDVPWLYGNDK